MDHKQQGQLIGYAIGGAVFLVIFSLRMRRMMQSRPFRLQTIWILPAIFLAMTGLALYAQPPRGAEWGWIAGAAVIGAGLGWFRAKTIRLTRDPATGEVMAQGSPLAMALILVLFLARFVLRGVMGAESGALGVRLAVIDSAFLAMACGLFIARTVEMGVRATRLVRPEKSEGAAA